MKVIGTITIICLFVCVWIFVFKATDFFNTTVGSDWLCGGALALIVSGIGTPFALVSLHKKD